MKNRRIGIGALRHAVVAAPIHATIGMLLLVFVGCIDRDRPARLERARQAEAAQEAEVAAIRTTLEFSNRLQRTLSDTVTIIQGTVVSTEPDDRERVTSGNREPPPAVKVVVDPSSIRYARNHQGPGENFHDAGANVATSRLVLITGIIDQIGKYVPHSTHTFYCGDVSGWDAIPIAGVLHEAQDFFATTSEDVAYWVAFEIWAERDKIRNTQGGTITP
jgi:hypothetical protein